MNWEMLYNLAELTVATGILIGVPVAIYKTFMKCFNWLDARTDKVKRLERCVENLKLDVHDGIEERVIMMRAMKATLEAVSNRKCNGNVTDAIEDINDYLIVRGHEPKTKLRKKMEDEKSEN